MPLTPAGIHENAAATGDLDVSENLTVTGAGIGITVLDGKTLDGVFDIDPVRIGVIGELAGGTVQNGKNNETDGFPELLPGALIR